MNFGLVKRQIVTLMAGIHVPDGLSLSLDYSVSIKAGMSPLIIMIILDIVSIATLLAKLGASGATGKGLLVDQTQGTPILHSGAIPYTGEVIDQMGTYGAAPHKAPGASTQAIPQQYMLR
eukprot:gb/GECG01014935.1/.p1 GENE.gb/GECG01014935.1/~~gb/GECG01014935.1/.p1  ORF type:complete len:120 (+),score=6.54 gb/GECG01014935.1/:1-360(+)